MIKFACEHCDQKIRVAKESAGKKGRCPKCQQAVTVPELALQDLSNELKLIEPVSDLPEPAQELISYECHMCSNRLRSPKADEGKIKECPHCGCFVEVADPNKSQVPQVEEKAEIQTEEPVPYDFIDPVKMTKKSVDIEKPKRTLPFFLDIFLYPLNGSGILSLVIFTIAPVLLYPVIFFGFYGFFAYIGLMVCLFAYILRFFSLCILTSAEGQVRAPDTFNQDSNETMMDMLIQLYRTLMLVLICMVSPFVYLAAARSVDVLFVAIMAACIFFLPMMLLASVMFNSFWTAWDPRVIIGGMFSSFLSYLGLVGMFYIPIALYGCIAYVCRDQVNIFLGLVLNAFSMYMLMVSSHLLGWFFYKNEEKLYWSV